MGKTIIDLQEEEKRSVAVYEYLSRGLKKGLGCLKVRVFYFVIYL